MQFFERAMKNLEVENRHLQDQCIELKGKLRHMQRDPYEGARATSKEKK